MNQHFKKRKSRTAPVAKQPKPAFETTAAAGSSTAAVAPAVDTPAATADGANLASALNALKVSLKRDFENFMPPTPAVSPAHSRTSAKRARVEFFPALDECEPLSEDRGAKLSANSTPKKNSHSALLVVSNRLNFELERRRRKDADMQPKRKRTTQLSYFTIIGAFHRAAHERNLAVAVHSVDATD